MPDYNFLMDSRLRPDQLRVVNQLGRLAASQGLILYLAGSSARDLILGFSSARDLSFVVEGNMQKILRPLTSRAAQRAETARRPGGAPDNNGFDLRVASLNPDSKLNRARVVFEGGVGAEIAMSRSEVYGAPGKPPTVSPGTIFDDLRRRDFSIDAMAISLHPNSRGLLLDPTNGAADIERRELRALHSRSFFDDPSRIYRLIRLNVRLDFKPDEKTERWLGMALEERVWEHLSEEQQGRELLAILGEESSGKLIKQLRDRDLIAGLDRKLASTRIEFDKFERIRAAARTAGASEDAVVLLNFHALASKLTGGEHNRLAKKILRDAKLIKTALNLEREAGQLAKVLVSPKADKPSQIYTVLSSAAPPLVLFLLVYDTRAAVQNRLKAFFTKYPAIRAELPRSELQGLGMPSGPKFEKVIDQIFLDQLDGKIKSPQQLTKLLMDYGGIKPPPPPAPAPKAAAKASAGKSPIGRPVALRVESQQPAAVRAGAPPEAAKSAKSTVPIKRDSPETKRPQSPPISTKAKGGAGSIAAVVTKRAGGGTVATRASHPQAQKVTRPSQTRARKVPDERKSAVSSRLSSGSKRKPKPTKAAGGKQTTIRGGKPN